MSHDCGICSTMPMYFAGQDVNHVPHLEFLRLFPFGTNEAYAKGDGQNLAPFVFVQKVRAPGVKHTLFAIQSLAWKTGSIWTVPMKVSVGLCESAPGLWGGAYQLHDVLASQLFNFSF